MDQLHQHIKKQSKNFLQEYSQHTLLDLIPAKKSAPSVAEMLEAWSCPPETRAIASMQCQLSGGKFTCTEVNLLAISYCQRRFRKQGIS